MVQHCCFLLFSSFFIFLSFGFFFFFFLLSENSTIWSDVLIYYYERDSNWFLMVTEWWLAALAQLLSPACRSRLTASCFQHTSVLPPAASLPPSGRATTCCWHSAGPLGNKCSLAAGWQDRTDAGFQGNQGKAPWGLLPLLLHPSAFPAWHRSP